MKYFEAEQTRIGQLEALQNTIPDKSAPVQHIYIPVFCVFDSGMRKFRDVIPMDSIYVLSTLHA